MRKDYVSCLVDHVRSENEIYAMYVKNDDELRNAMKTNEKAPLVPGAIPLAAMVEILKKYFRRTRKADLSVRIVTYYEYTIVPVVIKWTGDRYELSGMGFNVKHPELSVAAFEEIFSKLHLLDGVIWSRMRSRYTRKFLWVIYIDTQRTSLRPSIPGK